MASTILTPTDFFTSALNRNVSVKLHDGTLYKGVLVIVDGYMNVAMENAEEYTNGKLVKTYGYAVIRGNNVLYVSAEKRRAVLQ